MNKYSAFILSAEKQTYCFFHFLFLTLHWSILLPILEREPMGREKKIGCNMKFFSSLF